MPLTLEEFEDQVLNDFINAHFFNDPDGAAMFLQMLDEPLELAQYSNARVAISEQLKLRATVSPH